MPAIFYVEYQVIYKFTRLLGVKNNMQVQTLEGLKRQVDIVLSRDEIEAEVAVKLKEVSKGAKIQGFRPGKAPMSVIERNYGGNVRYDVINRKVGQAFDQFAKETDLRIAGMPSIEPKDEDVSDGQVAFAATFEVYPEIKLPEVDKLEIAKYKTEVTDKEVEETIDVLRKQRASYKEVDRAAKKDDRLTVDFVGRLDGEEFEGGKANDFVFNVGQGQMLPEFEEAADGMKKGESKKFEISFPEDYQSPDVAGKTAEFELTVSKIEEPELPELDAEFAKSLGQEDGDVTKLTEEIKNNISREVENRILNRNKTSVMEAIAQHTDFDVPAALINNEVANQLVAARENLKQRGVPDADKMDLPTELFKPEAEKRVRLGLLVSKLVEQEKLEATDEQINARIESFSKNYEQPQEVIDYYANDPQRRADVEASVVEENVVEYVFSKAKVTETEVPFKELMG